MEISDLESLRLRIDRAARAAGTPVRLLAVSKRQADAAVRDLVAQGQCAFGENYVQALANRRRELADLAIEWHLIGPLQSNKFRAAAEGADWVQSVDRESMVRGLASHRPAARPPLDVLVQVNIDREPAKSGCTPEAALSVCVAAAAEPRLRLRGLMAIPRAWPGVDDRRRSFVAMRELFEGLRGGFADFDTLSMGMSDDFELAIAEGATMVRVGSALFGARTGTPDL